jgi:hypothetical protein
MVLVRFEVVADCSIDAAFARCWKLNSTKFRLFDESPVWIGLLDLSWLCTGDDVLVFADD